MFMFTSPRGVRVSYEKSGSGPPLVLVHANLINNVLANDFTYRVPDLVIWVSAL